MYNAIWIQVKYFQYKNITFQLLRAEQPLLWSVFLGLVAYGFHK